MSSWFSYFRNSIIREEDPEQQQQLQSEFDQPSTSNPSPGDISSFASEQSIEGDEQQQFKRIPLVPSLSQEQREHIHDVLRRAQRSGRSARVVMDTKHLRAVRGGRGHPLTPSSINYERENESNENNENDGIDKTDIMAPEIIQMDSLPEDVEITVGPCPSSYCSYASSELMFSEEETETNKEKGNEESMENRITIAQRMAKMSRKIDKWLKSLDVDEEGEVEDEEKEEEDLEIDKIPKSPSFLIQNIEQSLNENQLLAAYLDTLSLCISVSAIEQCSIIFSQIVEKFSRNEAADIVYLAINDFVKNESFLPHFSTEEDNSSTLSANNCYIILVDEEQQKQNENIKDDNDELNKINDTNKERRPLIPMITIDIPEEEEEIIENDISNEDLINMKEQNTEQQFQAVLPEVEAVHEESDNSGQTSGADTEGPSSFEEEEYIEKQIILAEVHEGEDEISETLPEAENKTKTISSSISSEESHHSITDKHFDNIEESETKESSNSTSSSSTSLADTPVSSISIQDIIEKVIKEEIKDEKIEEEHLPIKNVDNSIEEIKQKNLPCISLISENIFEFKNEKECECNFVLKKEEKEEINGELIKEKEF
ncbi:hypothetical protein ACQ4LE_002243, partial [Meloidogyne hapla]